MPKTSLHIDQPASSGPLRDHLRALPSLLGDPPGFDPSLFPATPRELFLKWLLEAEEAGVPEPHAMTVSTVDSTGMPDARVLVLKDVTADGLWCFAGSRDSAKGQQLNAHPVAALTFYWREQLRSVRLRGPVSQAPQAVAYSDFAARSIDARAVALSGRQSTPLTPETVLQHDLERARQRLAAAPDLGSDEWTVWQLDPSEIEFWEGTKTRLHTRLRYRRSEAGWTPEQLRP